MMNERRVYTRVRIDKDCDIIPATLNNEYVARLHDVSEGGLCLVINEPEYHDIPVGSVIQVDIVDEFPYFDEIKKAVLSGDVIVVRVDGQYFGCKLCGSNKEYSDYIQSRKGHRPFTIFGR